VDRYGWLGRQQREWDPEVGLTLMGVRGYDPALGRFLSVDPIRGGSANDYDYAAGDPCNREDLDGTFTRRRAGSRCFDAGSFAAGSANVLWGSSRVVVGYTTMGVGIAALGTPAAPVGVAGIVWGAVQGTLGALRAVRGGIQLSASLRRPISGDCSVGGHVKRFLQGIVPNNRSLIDFIGGF
jgi:RHS repeat-associated protein